MILYHILSEENLIKKQEYAKENNGKLLLTSSIKGLEPHLYCLKNLVGGTLFAVKDKSRAIKINLESNARIYSYKGMRGNFTIELHNQLAKSHDLIHCMYDDPGLLWQEIFLVNPSFVNNWTYDVNEIQKDFDDQINDLNIGKLSGDDFFYREMSLQNQLLAAQLIGCNIGLNNALPKSKEKIEELYDKACYELGVLKTTMTKKMFFCTMDFIEAVNYISKLAKDREHEVNSSMNFIFSEQVILWDDFDAIISKKALELKGLIKKYKLKIFKPLIIKYENPSFDFSSNKVCIKIGTVINRCVNEPLWCCEKYVCQTKKLEHVNSFINLESSYMKLLADIKNPNKMNFQETYYSFYGARSDKNGVKIELLI